MFYIVVLVVNKIGGFDICGLVNIGFFRKILKCRGYYGGIVYKRKLKIKNKLYEMELFD